MCGALQLLPNINNNNNSYNPSLGGHAELKSDWQLKDTFFMWAIIWWTSYVEL